MRNHFKRAAATLTSFVFVSATLPKAIAFDPAETAANGTFAYVLGRGDQIAVTDYGGQVLGSAYDMQTVTILPDGTVSVYPVGVVRAKGRTLTELTKLINDGAAKYMIHPEFLVTLVKPRPVSVYVLGDVANPGFYNLSSATKSGENTAPAPAAHPNLGGPANTTNVSSSQTMDLPDTTTVITALRKAGGLRDNANVRAIKVTRFRTKEVLYVDLWKLLVDGDYAQDLELEPRDTVFVARGGIGFNPEHFGQLAANQTRTVRIWGEVKQPGLYQLSPRDDLLSVIAKAGGFAPNAVRSSVLLSRVSEDGTVIKKKISINDALKDKGLGRMPVQAGDVIVVGHSALSAASRPALIAGLTIIGAMIVIYYGSRVKNINVQSTPP